MFVIRKKLSASEITPSNLRWNADCSCVQQTFDNGATWVDAPGQDPRSSDAFRAPALTTSDPRCDAAANMLAKLHAAVDMAIAFDNSVRLAGELFALFALAMPALGVIVAVFTIIADVLLALGAAAIDGAFTSDVYDQLLCVFYDNIDADGQMSDAQLSDIYTAVAAGFDEVVQAVFGAVSSAAGAVGWSNAGALGSETGDCTSCAEWCYTFDFTSGEHGWAVGGFFGANPVGIYTGSAFQTGYDAPNSIEVLQIYINFTSVELVGVDVRYHGTTGSEGYFNFDYLVSGASIHNFFDALLEHHTYPADSDVGDAATVTCDELVIGVEAGAFSDIGTMYIDRVTLFGTGDNPFGMDNCP